MSNNDKTINTNLQTLNIKPQNTPRLTFNNKNVHEPQLLFLGRVPIDNLSPITPIDPEILKQKKEMEGY